MVFGACEKLARPNGSTCWSMFMVKGVGAPKVSCDQNSLVFVGNPSTWINYLLEAEMKKIGCYLNGHTLNSVCLLFMMCTSIETYKLSNELLFIIDSIHIFELSWAMNQYRKKGKRCRCTNKGKERNSEGESGTDSERAQNRQRDIQIYQLCDHIKKVHKNKVTSNWTYRRERTLSAKTLGCLRNWKSWHKNLCVAANGNIDCCIVTHYKLFRQITLMFEFERYFFSAAAAINA